MNIRRLTDRVRLILTTPKTEWPVIAGEPATVQSLYTGYIVILAAIPAVCMLIRLSLIGGGIAAAIVRYIVSLVAVFIVALIVDALAPTFGGQKDRVQALKTMAYSASASWVAGIGMLLPGGLAWLVGLAGFVYSIYLLYLGLPHTMKAPADRAARYTAVVAVVSFLIFWILGVITGGLRFTAAGFGM